MFNPFFSSLSVILQENFDPNVIVCDPKRNFCIDNRNKRIKFTTIKNGVFS
jgi:hypothetical protein